MSTVICMATCNGERWLPAQLDSLLAQTEQDWRLLISDDGSSDGTGELLHAYQRRDSRIDVLAPRRGEPGAAANFEYLLRAALRVDGAPTCVALCDQDDLWEPDKLLLQLEALAVAQGCCSDLALVDEAGEQTAPSFLRQLHAPERPGTADLLAQNSVVGCSLAIRPAVLELALPFPAGLQNHDWWLGLCALALGELQCLQRPLVRYRQHGGNEIGAYRPARQLFRLPTLVARQRRVLCGQLFAVAELVRRLEARGERPAPELSRYAERIGATPTVTRVGALLRGDFAAPHVPLRYLRAVAALRPLTPIRTR